MKRWGQGNAVEVLLPVEVMRGLTLCKLNWIAQHTFERATRGSKDPAAREAILRRERGRCFYCRERLRQGRVWLDHVEPLARGGWPTDDNLVACCERCNRMKGMRPAEELLERLRQRGVVSRARVAERKRVLAALRAKAEALAA